MTIVEATRDYESWARRHIALVPADLRMKHERMAEAAFPFLRATFYRWAQRWRALCPALDRAPRLLAVGDLHLENFGTWRDAEGRLVWGINDFDEAAPMPYAIDLVRLAVSAILARGEGWVAIGAREACGEILEGYAAALARGGKAFVLEESHAALRAMAMGAERDPVRFWAKMAALPRAQKPVRKIRALLETDLPRKNLRFRLAHRVAGLGSLGRQRFVALAEWRDGLIAREAKALMPSAYFWMERGRAPPIQYRAIVDRAVRCPDPFLRIEQGWIIRRLAPHCSRIELADFPKRRDERRILEAMGHETANVHLGSPRAIAAVRRDLAARKGNWLAEASEIMAEATRADWKAWRKAQ